MKIKETYLTFDENGKLERNFCTFGQAQCNLNGLINLKKIIDDLKIIASNWENVYKNIDNIFENWKERKHLLDDLLEKESKLYSTYYDIIHTILTKEEIEKIQNEIYYSFISERFVDEMVKLLESKMI